MSIAFIRSIHATTGIPLRVLAAQIDNAPKAYNGYTLQEMFDYFDETVIKYNDKKYVLKLRLDECRGAADVLNKIRSGQPVMMIVETCSHFIDTMVAEARKNHPEMELRGPGILDTSVIDQEPPLDLAAIREWQPDMHTMLLFGYDVAKNMVIGIEGIQPNGVDGYFKFYAPLMNKKFAKYFVIIVDDFAKV